MGLSSVNVLATQTLSQHGCRVMSRVLVLCHSSFQHCHNLPTHSTISGCHFAFPPHVSIRTSAPFGNIWSSRHDVATTLRQLRCDELVIIPFHVGMLVQFTTSGITTDITKCYYAISDYTEHNQARHPI